MTCFQCSSAPSPPPSVLLFHFLAPCTTVHKLQINTMRVWQYINDNIIVIHGIISILLLITYDLLTFVECFSFSAGLPI